MQYAEFATDPCRSLFKRIGQIFMGATPGANANVSIGKIGRWFVAQTPRTATDGGHANKSVHLAYNEEFQIFSMGGRH